MEENESMIASEPAIAYATTSYADVMDYIHSIHISREDKEKVAQRLSFEVTQPALRDAYERVDHLATLQKDWDGRGALPISHKVLNNIKQILMFSRNSDWEHWMMAPDVNATVGLQSDRTGAVVSIGAYEFSYYARIDGMRYGESHVDFDPEVLLGLMRKLG